MAYTEKIKSLFGSFALFIASHPWKFCLIGFLINGFLGLGMLNLPRKHLLNNNIEDVYMPRDTETEKMAQEILKKFPEHSKDAFYHHQSVQQPLFAELVIWEQNKESIINESFHEILSSLIEEIKNLSFTSVDGNVSNFYDICARRNDKCVVSGKTIIDNLKDSKDGTIPAKSLMPKNTTILENQLFQLADYQVANDTLVRATYLRIRFNLCHDTPEQAENAGKWMDRFVSHMKESTEKWHSKNLLLAFSNSKSFLEEIGNDTFTDIPYFSFVFTVYLIYIGFTMSGGNILAKRVHIGRMGVIVTPTSVLGAWGILMACKVEFTNVLGITPVLIVCHQIINTMITLSHLADANDISDGRKRVAYAVRMSSIPITVTMMCYMIPFATAIVSKYYAVELVGIYMVTTILFNYVNHFVFYTACLAIHEQRIDAGRHCCICIKLRTREELEGRNCCIICCCSGSRPNSRTDTESSIEKLTRIIMLRVLLTTPVKIIAFVSLLVLVGSTLFGLVNVNIDVFQKNEVLSTSYFYNWNEIVNEQFKYRPIIQFVTYHPSGYLNDSSSVLELKQKLVDKQQNLLSWSDVYRDKNYPNASSESDLYKSIKNDFLKKEAAFVNDIYFDESRSVITASRFYIQSKDIVSSKELISLKHDLLCIAEKFDDILKDKYQNFNKKFLPISSDTDIGFIQVHSPDFFQIDDFLRPLWEILIFTGTQLGILFLLFLLLKPSIRFLLLLLITYILMTMSIFGISNFVGVYLTQVSLIMYLVAGCFCVDIIVHIFYAFSQAPCDNKAGCLNTVLSNSIQSVFHAVFGLFLGILVLFVVHSYVFVTVFRISILTYSICILFTILWIPSVFSIVGPVDSTSQPETISIYRVEKVLDKRQSRGAGGMENPSFEHNSKHE